MDKKLVAYGGGLIALYLIVAHGSAFGTALTAGANGTATIVKTLQGRG